MAEEVEEDTSRWRDDIHEWSGLVMLVMAAMSVMLVIDGDGDEDGDDDDVDGDGV